MIEAIVSAKAAAIAVWFAGLALAERALPASPRPPNAGAARLFRNLGLWAVNAAINPFIVLPISIGAATLDVWSRPDLGWAGFAFDLLLLDLWMYWQHRAYHEWTPLWRLHRVHHLDRFLDTTSAVRFHPGEVAASALARAPLIIAADIPILTVAVFDTLVTLSALFHHSNVRLPARIEAALRLVIVTPSHHWVHHHTPRRDTNANYGALLTLWDRLFGSWSPTRRTPDMAIGSGDAPDAPLPRLMLAPLAPAPRP